ncbi:MAG TPA: helix-turn-helix transcriptional regulator [Terracidiphilus sp.]|nr:helix-turn-helix transcriptional regulator [Terracidiphilus sp.]
MPRRKLDPLPSVAFQILLALADQPLHGYAIMRHVSEQTENRMRLGPATLYGSIQSLLEAELIEDVDAPAAEESASDRRRYYAMTRAGRKIAREEAERLARVLNVARAKKILRGEHA